jgi:hypothetical protein
MHIDKLILVEMESRVFGVLIALSSWMQMSGVEGENSIKQKCVKFSFVEVSS